MLRLTAAKTVRAAGAAGSQSGHDGVGARSAKKKADRDRPIGVQAIRSHGGGDCDCRGRVEGQLPMTIAMMVMAMITTMIMITLTTAKAMMMTTSTAIEGAAAGVIAGTRGVRVAHPIL